MKIIPAKTPNYPICIPPTVQFADDAPSSPENDARVRTHTMGKRCVFATIATIVAIAIALGVGLGLGLKSDDAAAGTGIYVYGDTQLTGFTKSAFEADANNALKFRRGIASLSTTVEYTDVTITSVTDLARRRAALRKLLAVNSRVSIAFNVAVSDATEQTSVKTTYQAVTPTTLKTALTGQGLPVTAATAPTVTVTAPAPAPAPTPTPAAVSGLSAAARSNAIAAALNPPKVTMIPSEGVSTTPSSSGSARVDGRWLAEVQQLNASTFSATSDYKTAPPMSTYVDSVSTEIFGTPNMILCFIKSTNWTNNLNTGPYIAALDPYNCDTSGQIKGQISYRWVVNASGPDLDDANDTRDYKANIWVHLYDNSHMPHVDTQLVVKRADLAIKSDKVLVKNMTFTYQTPSGSPTTMSGVVRTECETTAADSNCTATGVTWWERQVQGALSFEMGARSRTVNGIAKASFTTQDNGGALQPGNLVTTDTHVKMTVNGLNYCDKLQNRSFFGEMYGAYDSTGKKVKIQSYANLEATGTDNITYGASLNYPGNLYVDSYDDFGTELVIAKKIIAQNAFVDGAQVTEIVDDNDASKNVIRKLKIQNGVLYKFVAMVQPASDYKGATLTSEFWNDGLSKFVKIQFKYDATTSKLMLTSMKTQNAGSYGNNTIITPRELTLVDVDNQIVQCWAGIFGQGSASLLNLTHFKVFRAEPVTPGSLSADLTLTCGERCIDVSQIATVSSYDNQFYSSPNGYSDARSTYKKFVFNKDSGSLKEDVSGTLGADVVYDPSNSWFTTADPPGMLGPMTLFEETNANFATLNCALPSATCDEAKGLDVYYEWRSARWDSMSWLEDPSNSTAKKFMEAPLTLQGKIPANAVLPNSPSGTNYAGVNLNIRYEGGWVSGTPFICYNWLTSQRALPEVDQYGNEKCDRANDFYRRPDVIIPDGTTFEQPSTGNRFVLKLEGGVEMLTADSSTACASITYDTTILVPTNTSYTAFTMPTKPSMVGLQVKGSD